MKVKPQPIMQAILQSDTAALSYYGRRGGLASARKLAVLRKQDEVEFCKLQEERFRELEAIHREMSELEHDHQQSGDTSQPELWWLHRSL